MTHDERTAVHEAAHCVIALQLGVAIRSVTINASADAWGQFTIFGTLKALDRLTVGRILLAGPEAERYACGYCEGGRIAGQASDYEQLTQLLTTKTRRIAGTAMADLIVQLEKFAAADVRGSWRDIERVADVLLRERTIHGSALDAIISK